MPLDGKRLHLCVQWVSQVLKIKMRLKMIHLIWKIMLSVSHEWEVAVATMCHGFHPLNVTILKLPGIYFSMWLPALFLFKCRATHFWNAFWKSHILLKLWYNSESLMYFYQCSFCMKIKIVFSSWGIDEYTGWI